MDRKSEDHPWDMLRHLLIPQRPQPPAAPGRTARLTYSPKDWSKFVGYQSEMAALREKQKRADERGEMMGPVLIFGPPGTGKTTALELLCKGRNVMRMTGNGLDAYALISRLIKGQSDQGTYYIIDEIHAMKDDALEVLYPVIDRGEVSYGGETMPLRATILAATTQLTLPDALLSRFYIITLGPYREDELVQIGQHVAEAYGMEAEPGGIELAARLARCVPRQLIKLIEQVRDMDNRITVETVARARIVMGLSDEGLTRHEQLYLCYLATQRRGAREDDPPCASKATMMSLMGVDARTIERIEAALLRDHYIAISGRGRILLARGFQFILRITASIKGEE